MTYGHLKVANILIAHPGQQTPSLKFWGLDLSLYTKCQKKNLKKKKKEKRNYSKFYYNSHLVLKFAFGVCIVSASNA